MDLKEQIDINITDLVNRIDRLTSGNIGHSKNQLRFQIKKVGEFVNELCESQKANTGERQLNIPDVRQALIAFKHWEQTKCRQPYNVEPSNIVDEYLGNL